MSQAIALQFRHGTTSEHASFTGILAEVTVDTDLKTLRVHDGSTVGGHVMAKKSDVDASITEVQNSVLEVENELEGKADSSHSHAISDVVGLSDAINTAAANAVPPGTIITFGGRTIPSGYLPCNGMTVSRTQYPNLFAAIGTIYGSGDGSTTFHLPNDHHRVDEGTTSASEVGKKVEAGAPNITGTLKNGRAHMEPFEASGALTYNEWASKLYKNQVGGALGGVIFGFNASLSNSRFGSSSTIQPNSMRRYHLIKW